MDASNIEKRKTHFKHEPREKYDKSMLGHLVILFDFVKRQIVQGSSKIPLYHCITLFLTTQLQRIY